MADRIRESKERLQRQELAIQSGIDEVMQLKDQRYSRFAGQNFDIDSSGAKK